MKTHITADSKKARATSSRQQKSLGHRMKPRAQFLDKNEERVGDNNDSIKMLFLTHNSCTFIQKGTGLSVHPSPWNWQKVQNHQPFSRLSLISLFQDYFFDSIIHQSFSGLHFSYVSFLEKRPGFKFTRYHGTDDWSSSSQVNSAWQKSLSTAWIQTQHLETCLKSWHLW